MLWVNRRMETEPKAIKKAVMESFSARFSEPYNRRPTLDGRGFRQLTDDQAKKLIEEFSREEIKEAVWACGSDRAPGPDGFSFKFIKRFWVQLEKYFVGVLKEFHKKAQIGRGCNSSFIALIPKTRDPKSVSDFRPISLIGVIYKVIAKVLATRIKKVIPSVVASVQTAFVEGRLIFDGPIITSEIISWAKKKHQKIFVFKVDFEKAYDSINWKFLLANLKAMKFPALWRKWVGASVKSCRASVLVNGSPTSEFKL
ncbi:putative RNA-directed DNA polymerase [Helianthus annuus]|nr:putative RNA-directed DNA polymerase [Helianthus annuus]